MQQHRASLSTSLLHSNGSLTLYRNYQRTVLKPGVALLLATAGHDYQFGTAPEYEEPGMLTDGRAVAGGCASWAAGAPTISISLNLTVVGARV